MKFTRGQSPLGCATLAAALCMLSVASGCTSESLTPPGDGSNSGLPIEPESDTDYLSHVPGAGGDNGGGNVGTGTGSAGATGGEAAADGSVNFSDALPEAGNAERAIVEADIIQIQDDRLYALSEYAGLTIVDVSDPKQLKVLGRHRSTARPFEMYLRDGVLYVMFNGYETRVVDDETDEARWEVSARMQALDVSDPAKVRRIADHGVPGEISDSRLVGDILYLVTYQAGWCWRCDEDPATHVTSFDVHQRDRFAQVDDLRFPSSHDSWGPRSVSATQQRLYVAGDGWGNASGAIDVVDISDVNGELVKGATLEIAGQIESRWQMEEIGGVLYVISQRDRWRAGAPPVLETFEVEDSDTFTKLASLEMVLPRPESLRSVRFDGDRAYAVTFERTDPLFTFDLRDPANPQQLGELEIPGWLYHMEPRGDVLYALGFEEGTDEPGALHVSRFDVSDLAKPTMTDRVHFGGDWGRFAEDQDRIHKAFNILEDEGLILVPFGGGSYGEDDCSYTYQSGIQLVELTADGLRERGVAPQRGQARRALLHAGHLLGVSDESVQVFDIADLDAPAPVDRLDVARNVSAVRIRGDQMVRFGTDWWTDESVLDYVDLERADQVEGDGSLELDATSEEAESCYGGSDWDGRMFVHGRYAYLPREDYGEHGTSLGRQWWERVTFIVVDLEADGGPQVSGRFATDRFSDSDGWIDNLLLTDSALLVGRQSRLSHWDETARSWIHDYTYDIYDLGDDGSAPTFTKSFTLPSQLSGGGWGRASVGCGMGDGWGYWYSGYGSGAALVSGDIVASQHMEPLDDGTGRARYFLDRLDVSNPAKPKLLTEVSIPGTVVLYDHPSKRVLTIDHDREERTVKKDDWDACYGDGYPEAYLDGTKCEIYRRHVNSLVVEGNTARRVDRVAIEERQPAIDLGVSAKRLFYVNQKPNRDALTAKATVHALRFGEDGELEKLPVLKTDAPTWGWYDFQVIGTRAFRTGANELYVLDASEDGKPVETRHEMPGWSCSSLEVKGDHAYCAMGQSGVLDVPL